MTQSSMAHAASALAGGALVEGARVDVAQQSLQQSVAPSSRSAARTSSTSSSSGASPRKRYATCSAAMASLRRRGGISLTCATARPLMVGPAASSVPKRDSSRSAVGPEQCMRARARISRGASPGSGFPSTRPCAPSAASWESATCAAFSRPSKCHVVASAANSSAVQRGAPNLPPCSATPSANEAGLAAAIARSCGLALRSGERSAEARRSGLMAASRIAVVA
mmetsp:Transcript_30602/g.96548  ORF Transcript_30602/g.96548 Transcript_30602/m.96548 type:complete len:224 (-) Transcript_30602:32-703(-)